jgi:lipopolysaccharide transport system ATP-binding protein
MPTDSIWALKDVSFEVKHGEVVGIIGSNGAGKSTLLKILSQITEPTKGVIDIYGRVGALLEVGTGFHPELTGRENVYLNGAILGMRREEINRKFDEIVDFSGVQRFIDTPVKHYSSGMQVRLAFAVAAHLEPEILIVDEVLAVGDAEFQKKCLNKMGDVTKEGRTVLFVSHNMGAINQLCQMSIWIDQGSIKSIGNTPDIVSAYLKKGSSGTKLADISFEEEPGKDVQLRRARLLDSEWQPAQVFDCDHPVVIELIMQVHHQVPGLYGYLQIARADGTEVMISDSFDTTPNPLDNLPAGIHTIRIVIPARTLGHGEYNIYLNFTSRQSGKGFNVDSPGTILWFTLSDLTSLRGNKRRGFFSTLPDWQYVSAVSSVQQMERK